jgi:hypothetical protein
VFNRTFAVGVTIVALTTSCAVHTSTAEQRSAGASIDHGVIDVGGRGFFPIMLIDQCGKGDADNAHKLGINLILNETCAGVPPLRQLAMIRNGTLAVLPLGAHGLRGGQLVGWTFPDEPESNGWTPSSLRAAQPYPRGNADGLLTFMTTGGGFFRPPYRDPRVDLRTYREFARMSDVAGFDLYPLDHCHRDLSAVYGAQRAFTRLAGATPTFQWIETGPIEPGYCGGFQMTPAELTAEVWLAIVGGARGIGYFTHTWSPEHKSFEVLADLQTTIKNLSGVLSSVEPGLLGQTVRSRSNSRGVKFLARTAGTTTYVFAVNSQSAYTTVQTSVPDLRNEPLEVIGENRSLPVQHHVFVDTFPPLAVHIYMQRP